MITSGKDKLGKLQSTCTCIKDGVDLQKEFREILNGHPFANMWSDAAKSLIALELFKVVEKDCCKS